MSGVKPTRARASQFSKRNSNKAWPNMHLALLVCQARALSSLQCLLIGDSY